MTAHAGAKNRTFTDDFSVVVWRFIHSATEGTKGGVAKRDIGQRIKGANTVFLVQYFLIK